MYIRREGEIKIPNSKINFISKKSGNQSVTAGLNKIKPKYTCRDQKLSKYISIRDKKEQQGRLRSKILKIEG